MNKCGIGICLVGDLRIDAPTNGQMESLVLLVNTLRKYYHIPPKPHHPDIKMSRARGQNARATASWGSLQEKNQVYIYENSA